jgi:purine-nucleoside phosphorylase
MSQVYDPGLQALAREGGDGAAHPAAQRGVRGRPGPNLETRAEYRMLRAMGADVVGMSTVPEVIVAIHGGMRVMGVSIITDACLPDALEVANIERIIATARRAEPG